jgi:beta-phosphoglucomutase-like phosphatase (HAD superfamily)
MKRGISGIATLLFTAAALFAAEAPPVLRLPGAPDRPIAPESLVGRISRDVRLESKDGDVTIYHGAPLLEVLEKNGLDLRTMAGERRSAAQVVLATARDGYTVVFSVGELSMNRANPKVFLVAESAAGPLPDNEGPVRLIVYGDVIRSPYGLARIELKVLAENARSEKK